MCSKFNSLNGDQSGMNTRLQQENLKLKTELQFIKDELQACMKKDLPEEEGGSPEDGDSCASLKNSEKRTQMYYLEEINILSLQLRETFETMSKIESVNNQLNKELMKVRCQYKKLQDDLKTQRALDEFTFMQVERALKDKQAGLFNRCKCLKDGTEEGQPEETNPEEMNPDEAQPESEAPKEEPPQEAPAEEGIENEEE